MRPNQVLGYILASIIYGVILTLVYKLPVVGFLMLAVFSVFAIYGLGEMIKEILDAQQRLRDKIKDNTPNE